MEHLWSSKCAIMGAVAGRVRESYYSVCTKRIRPPAVICRYYIICRPARVRSIESIRIESFVTRSIFTVFSPYIFPRRPIALWDEGTRWPTDIIKNKQFLNLTPTLNTNTLLNTNATRGTSIIVFNNNNNVRTSNRNAQEKKWITIPTLRLSSFCTSTRFTYHAIIFTGVIVVVQNTVSVSSFTERVKTNLRLMSIRFLATRGISIIIFYNNNNVRLYRKRRHMHSNYNRVSSSFIKPIFINTERHRSP